MSVMKLKSGVTAVWGTSAVAHTAFGIVTKASKKHASEKDKIQDTEGDTVGVIYFDPNDAIALDIICKSTLAEPTEGDSLTCLGITGLVDDYELIWEQKATKKMTVNVSKWKYALA
ncbi:MAG: hypothetical protein ACOYOU_00860 [Kiritimatiellia bacterium]